MGITHNEIMAIIGALVAIALWLSIISHQLSKISEAMNKRSNKDGTISN